ncbi:MAG: hypothetical protein KF906_11530 [Actinobacteria bacterium]|nr:hypothetical protein [Actinomycetota bacterium]
MPIDQPEATAAVNPRRTFLARAAVGGAVVTAGSIAGPLLRAVPAGAQTDTTSGSLDDSSFAALAVPLELGAVQVYEAATEAPDMDDDAKSTLRTFQQHHQTVADTLTDYYTGDADLTEDPAVVARSASVGGSANAAFTALAELEQALAATHLDALGSISDAITAKYVAGVLAVQGQQAVALTLLAGTDPAAVVPAAVTTDGALTTTTGEAGN